MSKTTKEIEKLDIAQNEYGVSFPNIEHIVEKINEIIEILNESHKGDK